MTYKDDETNKTKENIELFSRGKAIKSSRGKESSICPVYPYPLCQSGEKIE